MSYRQISTPQQRDGPFGPNVPTIRCPAGNTVRIASSTYRRRAVASVRK
jgi:hypothetical protein